MRQTRPIYWSAARANAYGFPAVSLPPSLLGELVELLLELVRVAVHELVGFLFAGDDREVN